jgi:quinoprotein glucose dehydrogenase
MRHSPLDQITPDNVNRLRVAWTYHTHELETLPKGSDVAAKSAFEATPIVVDGVMYLATPTNRVIALDARTGGEKWVYDPKVNLRLGYSEVTCRGVATWAPADGKTGRRIFVATIDGRLIALDAATGKPCGDFGNGGQVDLKADVGRFTPGHYQCTSPPAVLGDLVIVGTSMADNVTADAPRGVVRAYDAISGAVRWSFDPIPRTPHDDGYDTWRGDRAHATGGANVWPPISVDAGRNLVYLSTSCPSPDYFGGLRPGDNRHASSVVCLDGPTGAIRWAFQTVRHDVFDFDVPMQPVLLTLGREGKSVDAVAVGTKTGHLFVLDRQTGEPLFPNEDRPVPQTDVPGEQTAPTQPFPTALPTFGLRRLTADDAWGPTDAARAKARARIESLRSDGPFTPASVRGSIQAPCPVGGFNWGGLTYDPRRSLLVGATNRVASVVTLVPRDRPEKRGATPIRGDRAGMDGTPFRVVRDYLLDLDDAGGMFPQTPPPWGTLAAVNLQTGKLAWEVPLGLMADPRKYPDAEKWGSVNLGGPMTTSSGLTFVAASMDGHLRAFDTATGKLLWKAALPAGGQATPMTYALDGRQYVVICAGGHGKLGTKLGDAVVAFALPDAK